MLTKPLSKKKAYTISNGIFLLTLGILVATNAWWPGILLALWATIASRQYLSGKFYYALLSTFIFAGFYILSFFKLNFAILAPILLITGGIFIIFRGYFFTKEDTNDKEKSIEIPENTDLNK